MRHRFVVWAALVVVVALGFVATPVPGARHSLQANQPAGTIDSIAALDANQSNELVAESAEPADEPAPIPSAVVGGEIALSAHVFPPIPEGELPKQLAIRVRQVTDAASGRPVRASRALRRTVAVGESANIPASVGATYEAVAEAEGFVGEPVRIQLTGDRAEVSLRLFVPATLTVRLRDFDGQPLARRAVEIMLAEDAALIGRRVAGFAQIPGATVRSLLPVIPAALRRSEGATEPCGDSDDDGVIVIEGLTPMIPLRLIVSRGVVWMRGETLSLQSGERREFTATVLDGADIVGRLVLPDGSPAYAASVLLDGVGFVEGEEGTGGTRLVPQAQRSAVADGAGQFAFLGLPEGDWRVSIEFTGTAAGVRHRWKQEIPNVATTASEQTALGDVTPSGYSVHATLRRAQRMGNVAPIVVLNVFTPRAGSIDDVLQTQAHLLHHDDTTIRDEAGVAFHGVPEGDGMLLVGDRGFRLRENRVFFDTSSPPESPHTLVIERRSRFPGERGITIRPDWLGEGVTQSADSRFGVGFVLEGNGDPDWPVEEYDRYRAITAVRELGPGEAEVRRSWLRNMRRDLVHTVWGTDGVRFGFAEVDPAEHAPDLSLQLTEPARAFTVTVLRHGRPVQGAQVSWYWNLAHARQATPFEAEREAFATVATNAAGSAILRGLPSSRSLLIRIDSRRSGAAPVRRVAASGTDSEAADTIAVLAKGRGIWLDPSWDTEFVSVPVGGASEFRIDIGRGELAK